jgi:hypothetical protein
VLVIQHRDEVHHYAQNKIRGNPWPQPRKK